MTLPIDTWWLSKCFVRLVVSNDCCVISAGNKSTWCLGFSDLLFFRNADMLCLTACFVLICLGLFCVTCCVDCGTRSLLGTFLVRRFHWVLVCWNLPSETGVLCLDQASKNNSVEQIWRQNFNTLLTDGAHCSVCLIFLFRTDLTFRVVWSWQRCTMPNKFPHIFSSYLAFFGSILYYNVVIPLCSCYVCLYIQ